MQRIVSSSRRWQWAAALAAALAACGPFAWGKGADGPACPVPGAAAAEPYRWYPALDLARIPFHTGDGAWGPRMPIQAPEAPVTRRTVRVTSAAQFVAEARIPGTQIVVDAAYIGLVALAGDVSDLDIIVPPGKTLGQIWIGRYTPPSRTERVRIRGTTPGKHSGGLVGRIIFYSNPATDLIIDGVDLNGDDGNGGNLLIQFASPARRVAVVNVRGHGVGAASLGGGSDVVWAGNRIMSGARPGEVNGYSEGWGIRGGDRIVVFDNRIEGKRYHRVRIHPDFRPPQYAWIANNVFVDPHEGRILTAIDWSGGRGPTRLAGVWAVCNRVYAHTKCIPPSFEAPHANYARLTSNSFYGSITENLQRTLQNMHGPGRDYLTDNTYAPWRSPPAWDGPGDPTTTVRLPPVVATRFNAAQRGLDCPAP